MGTVSNIVFIMMPIVGGIFLAFGIFQVMMDLRTAKHRKVVDRLTESGPKKKQKDARDNLLRKRAQEIQGNALEGIVSKLQVVSKLQGMLDQADVDWMAHKMLINLVGLSGVTCAGMIFLKFSLASSVGAAAGVMVLPLLWLVRKRKKRIRVLVEQLPDVFELMSQALRAGHSLASSIQLISEQMPKPISGEFARVFHEQNLGIKIEEALLNMANRTDQMDVRFFVTAVLIQRQTGGDLAEVLDNIGAVIRDRIQLLGTVQALTAEGRLSGWVLLCLPVLVFCVALMVTPDYATTLLHTPAGQKMLASAAIMDLMGMAMIKKIVNIKV